VPNWQRRASGSTDRHETVIWLLSVLRIIFQSNYCSGATDFQHRNPGPLWKIPGPGRLILFAIIGS